ncbi:hypothetical protein TNCV_2265571 [Trichonephila clavipes]|nr:hypothetical protein TNCV_2265571 [Trichonephila clavipes]
MNDSVQKVCLLLGEDRQLNVRMIAEECGIPKIIVHRILTRGSSKGKSDRKWCQWLFKPNCTLSPRVTGKNGRDNSAPAHFFFCFETQRNSAWDAGRR